MKKIIAAFDGLKFSESTLSYALDIASISDCSLAGVFLDDFTYHSYKIYDMIGSQGVDAEKLRQLTEKDAETRKQSVLRFEEECQRKGINYLVHHDKSIALQELLNESIYSDLLIISAHETLTHFEEDIPTRFIKNLLIDVQCPVLIVPKAYKKIENVIVLYDGDPSSVYAVKMFSYMLAGLKVLPIKVVTVKSDEELPAFPKQHLIIEFIKCHFPSVKFKSIEGKPENEIINYLTHQQKNSIVILGAYRRNMVSRWFKPSMADALMKNTNLPLFVAHYK